jgi:hypothetical protein
MKKKLIFLSILFFLFFGFINVFNTKYFNKFGYMPVTENFYYILVPVNFIVSIIANFSYSYFPVLLKSLIIGNIIAINIISIIKLLLTLFYFYLLAYVIIFILSFVKNKASKCKNF